MPTKRTVQQFLGYGIGGLLVLFLIPRWLFRLSRVFDPVTGIQLIPIDSLRVTVAVNLGVFGLLFGLWSIVVQNTVAGLEVSPKTQNLVITGPYRYTRNPMLFGACLFYYGIAIYLDSLIAFAAVALFMTFMLIFVKLTEEPRLLKDFGSDYQEYRRRVSMFIPWKQKRPEK
jgi:protein-S-isoprenylcysteine O-methyltransferase Ste14